MRIFLTRIVFCAALAAVGSAAQAACNDSDGCADPGAAIIPAGADRGNNPGQPIQVAELPGNVALALAPGRDTIRATVKNESNGGNEAHTAGPQVLRTQDSRNSAAIRPARIERNRIEPVTAPLPEPSVWIMLLAGLAFAGVVVRKRSRG